mgnify:CR=1 FL=1
MALPRKAYPAITERVERMGIPKSRLCEAISVTYPALSDKLGGRTEFTLTEALRLARFFGVSVEELVGDAADPEGAS